MGRSIETLANLEYAVEGIDWSEDAVALDSIERLLKDVGHARLSNIYWDNVANAPGKANPHYLKSELAKGISARNYSQPMPYPEIPHTERLHTHKMIGVSMVLQGAIEEHSYSPASHAGSETGGLWTPDSWEEPAIAIKAVGDLLRISSTNRYWHRVHASNDALTLMISRKKTGVSYGLGDFGDIMAFPDFETQRRALVARSQHLRVEAA